MVPFLVKIWDIFVDLGVNLLQVTNYKNVVIRYMCDLQSFMKLLHYYKKIAIYYIYFIIISKHIILYLFYILFCNKVINIV